ncbi:deoxyribonuclease IV [Virgisporangium ochraceum]|uniref:Probable endonuclease 4 n=1 Tax=Virgisporangium ochraceum TaxID=65505 RepID=A0A8J3ZS13_9ACTN|nr:deoxyribonuclease IV [Virgisporangium ochraceum]GIJ68671.1 putative endonuclease 4 [Virgisporangium ochraceum]
MRIAARPVGGHATSAGGLATGVTGYLDATSASAVQVYVSNPRGWARPDGSSEQDERFRALCAERDVVAWVHACLLVNLGSPTPATVEQSAATLRHALRRAGEIGARGVVFHAGSAVTGAREAALDRVGAALRPILDGLDPDGPRLLVEPSAGGGQCLAKRVEDLGPYLDAVDRHPMLGVCFDTCHAWAAGHDLAAPGGAAATMDALVATVGPDRLWLLHANDSRDACGSTRDRHENVGAGSIGLDPFAALLAHPATVGVPVIVETPGHTAHEGHAKDIASLRSLFDG